MYISWNNMYILGVSMIEAHILIKAQLCHVVAARALIGYTIWAKERTWVPQGSHLLHPLLLKELN